MRLACRITVIAFIVALGWTICPRGTASGSIVFTCSRCGEQITVTRWQLESPRWLSFDYPGFTWTSRGFATPPVKEAKALGLGHTFELKISVDSGATTAAGPEGYVNLSETPIRRENALPSLKALMARSDDGLGPMIWIVDPPGAL